MGEYQGGQSEGQKYQEDRFSIMHFNDKTNEYKVLSINPLDDRKGIFLSIRVGTKGQPSNRLVLALTKAELASLIMESTKIYNQDLK